MKKSKGRNKKIVCLFILAGFLQIAQAGSLNYSISKYVFSGGGRISSSANYLLIGSIGQPLTAYSSNVNYELQSGFWHENYDLIFNNSFE